MQGLEEFLSVFGNVTILRTVEIVIALGFILYMWRKFKKYINDKHDAEQERDTKLQEALNGVRMYPMYRQQSIEIQHDLESKFDNVREMCENIMIRLDEIEERRDKTERKKLQETLLQHYRIFTDPNKNVMQAWTEMEATAFWDLFSEYEDKGGDGFMHSIVQPAMNKLTVINMNDSEKLYELMHSRKF